MAVLICLTIFLSALFSLTWLMAVLAVMGPEENKTSTTNTNTGTEAEEQWLLTVDEAEENPMETEEKSMLGADSNRQDKISGEV